MKQTVYGIISVLFLMVLPLVGIAKETDQMDLEEKLSMPQEHWYNTSMLGKKVGYVHTYFDIVDFQGERMLQSKTDIKFQIKGLGKDFVIASTRTEYSDLKFNPRYFIYTQKEPDERQVEGEIIDQVAHIKTTLNSQVTESEVILPKDTIFNGVLSNYLFAQDRLKIGEKLAFHIYDLDLLMPVKTGIQVNEKKSFRDKNSEIPVYEVKLNMEIMGGLNLTIWISENGIDYKTSTDMMGLPIIVTKTDRNTALGIPEDVDIMLKTQIVPSGKKPNQGASQLVVNLKLSKGNLKETVLINNRQKLKLDSEKTGRLSIQKETIDEDATLTLPVEEPEMMEFLSPTLYIESDHPDISAKAAEIIEGEDDAWLAAKKLSRWVYKHIRYKHLSGGFRTALSTFESSSGDCTEHTVLLIALARSVGIPARICSGLVYGDNAFYFHFWPEVYVGQWIQMDPTLGQVIADANHIQFGGGILESDTMLEFTEGVFRTVNQLAIEILE